MVATDALLAFFKALSDPNRLRIVGLLAHRPHTVDELATVLDLKPSTVSHHAKKLAAAGLVEGRADGHYHVYALCLSTLQASARRLLSEETLREVADDGNDAFDRKVLAAFLDAEGRITAIPMKRKKFDVLLRHALKLFDEHGEWTEQAVNARLKGLTDDVATLRRGLIDHGYMVRSPSGSCYRRTTQGERAGGDLR